MNTRVPLLTLATLAGAAALLAQEPRPAEPDLSRRLQALESKLEAQSYALDQLQKVYEDAPGGHSFNRMDYPLARESRAEVYRFLARYLKK
jgi:hypothetical protein